MFKVGDVVRVRKDLIVGEWYKGVEFLDSMNCFLGEEVEIRKPVEYKLYDCNGVELKEGDKVKCICLDDGDFYNDDIIRDSNGILYNSGFDTTHRADRNNGRKDNSDSDWKWYVVKIKK